MTVPETSEPTTSRLRDRYEIVEQFGERAGVERFRAIDHGAEGSEPVPVLIVRSAVRPERVVVSSPDDAAIPMDDNTPSVPVERGIDPNWRSAGWEKDVLSACRHPSLPTVLDHFIDNHVEFVVLEAPRGKTLWEAWVEPELTHGERFRLLKNIAEALAELHRAGAVACDLHPGIIVVTPTGRARIVELSDLVPLPVPGDAVVRPGLTVAPELLNEPSCSDARADLYCFGAMLYALFLERPLFEKDFTEEHAPRAFLVRLPDMHPMLGRLLNKTFQRDVELRFPTDAMARHDRSGFLELMETLDACGKSMDHHRFEAASWTTTGMIRSGNEDAFAVLHACQSMEDHLSDMVIVLLADGMGGYEAGEIAAAMTVRSLRRFLLNHPMFACMTGAEPTEPFQVDACRELLIQGLKQANQEIYQAARTGPGRQNMGCTAEVACLQGRHLVVGHVGDSRTYHLHQGRLSQVTRDQTMVNRLVDIGTLSPEDAEFHPRRSELYQAIGGRPEVEVLTYHSIVQPGDWVVVCSDGLSNEVHRDELHEMLRECRAAETAARRLVNLVNLLVGRDNATVVTVRVL